jgi:ribosomal-protein-alanine N-acetyltransferase
LNISEKKLKAELGFELLPKYQGKGIMLEVLPVIIEYGFKNMNLNSIEGEVDPENLKSIILMKRNGFIFNRKLENNLVYCLNRTKK